VDDPSPPMQIQPSIPVPQRRVTTATATFLTTVKKISINYKKKIAMMKTIHKKIVVRLEKNS